MAQRELRGAIGSLLWIGFEGTSLGPDVRRVLMDGDAGGVTLFKRNISHNDKTGHADLEAVGALNREIHALRPGILISVDQEGGRVQRLREPAYPPALCFAELGESEAEEAGYRMGCQLKEWGFDIDFAPVLDVHTNPANPIIGDRAFGTEPEAAALRAIAFADGLGRARIISCGKHFPGHGDTRTDSHLELPTLPHDMARLEAVELVPFRRAAPLVPMFMTAHVVFEALDPGVPATMSRRVLTDLLRGELGFSGVIVSDDLDMKAIADNFGVAEAALAAIEAGCDALLLCRDRDHQEAVRTAMHQRASTDAAFRDRVLESASRVARLCQLL